MAKKHLYLLAYDIESDKRRTKLARWLEDEGGERVNYSVFEMMIPPEKYQGFLQSVSDRISPKRDRVAIYPICKTCYAKSCFIPEKGPPPPKGIVAV